VVVAHEVLDARKSFAFARRVAAVGDGVSLVVARLSIWWTKRSQWYFSLVVQTVSRFICAGLIATLGHAQERL